MYDKLQEIRHQIWRQLSQGLHADMFGALKPETKRNNFHCQTIVLMIQLMG